jgi:hypothetical protein
VLACFSDGRGPFRVGAEERVVIAEEHAEEDLCDDAPTNSAELWRGDFNRWSDRDVDGRFRGSIQPRTFGRFLVPDPFRGRLILSNGR